MLLSLDQARAAIVREVAALAPAARVETMALDDATGRVLGMAVAADRDQPPFDRSTRDGFAVRSADVAAAGAGAVTLSVVGEVPAGQEFAGAIGIGACVEIMTGAPVPADTDAVVMVEHTEPAGDKQVLIKRAAAKGENIVPRGRELAAGAVAFPAGRRLDPAAIALLASLGCARPSVFARPRVAIITTGDEIVGIDSAPTPPQIRNSNLHSLAAQVVRAGGTPVALPIARDNREALRALIERGLAEADLLLLSGGVSMGKYDFVEGVLEELGAKIVFDGVAIRPGKPLVFGHARGKPFFGLPGNPLSTLVTFEVFVRPALDLLSGATPTSFRCTHARLAVDHWQKEVALTVFLPARFEPVEPDSGAAGVAATLVNPLPSQGSGDLVAMAKADCLLVIAPHVTHIPAGAPVAVLPK